MLELCALMSRSSPDRYHFISCIYCFCVCNQSTDLSSWTSTDFEEWLKQTAAVSPATRAALKDHQVNGTTLSQSDPEMRAELERCGVQEIDHLMGMINMLKSHTNQAQGGE